MRTERCLERRLFLQLFTYPSPDLGVYQEAFPFETIPLAVQSSAFLLKINPGDNFTPDRALRNLSVCRGERVEACYFFPPLAEQSVPEFTLLWPHQRLRSFLWKAQVHVFWDHA